MTDWNLAVLLARGVNGFLFATALYAAVLASRNLFPQIEKLSLFNAPQLLVMACTTGLGAFAACIFKFMATSEAGVPMLTGLILFYYFICYVIFSSQKIAPSPLFFISSASLFFWAYLEVRYLSPGLEAVDTYTLYNLLSMFMQTLTLLIGGFVCFLIFSENIRALAFSYLIIFPITMTLADRFLYAWCIQQS